MADTSFMDVVDKAVTIGASGFLGWLVAGQQISSAFRKDVEQRRAQLIIEIADFIEVAATSAGSLVDAKSAALNKIDTPSEKAAAEFFKEKAKAYLEDYKNLSRAHGRLVLLGELAAAEKLEAVVHSINALADEAAKSEQFDDEAAENVGVRMSSFYEELTKAFHHASPTKVTWKERWEKWQNGW